MTMLTIYVVEDSPVIRENLIATLEETVPVRVIGTADDEDGAVSWLRSAGNDPDLLIIDIFLRGGSGLGVLAAARAAGKTGKFVVFSNYATPDMRRKCLELGATRVFDKSDEIDALIDFCSALADP
ncbi:MAG: response regulator [Burkholderiaceae bacterium]